MPDKEETVEKSNASFPAIWGKTMKYIKEYNILFKKQMASKATLLAPPHGQQQKSKRKI